MIHSARRVWGMVYRHICLYRRSWPRLVEIAYWPTLELLIWASPRHFPPVLPARRPSWAPVR
ncbi:MAG TPA: hypothetical protein PLI12_10470, partial [Acetobacteraceae bacterium]|nr:hypothetical protein [Acetobacteraceae bacterium]